MRFCSEHWLFELHQHERNTVHEQHHIGATQVQWAPHAPLLHREQIVRCGVGEVQVAYGRDLCVAVLVLPLSGVAVAQQAIHFVIRTHRVHQRPVASDRLDCFIDCAVWCGAVVECTHYLTQSVSEDHLPLRITPQHASRPERLLRSIDGLPAKLGQQFHAWLLDVEVLGA